MSIGSFFDCVAWADCCSSCSAARVWWWRRAFKRRRLIRLHRVAVARVAARGSESRPWSSASGSSRRWRALHGDVAVHKQVLFAPHRLRVNMCAIEPRHVGGLPAAAAPHWARGVRGAAAPALPLCDGGRLRVKHRARRAHQATARTVASWPSCRGCTGGSSAMRGPR